MSASVPRANPLLFGHAAAEAILADAARSGRLHHAWLITGPEGVGKATLAYRFARRLLAGVPDEQSLALDAAHPVFRRVATGAHADLLTVELAYDDKHKRMRAQISVDDVRRISAFMALTPAEGGWRVAIVDGAENLNQNSANALLKILEEPPRRAILLLVCSSPGTLLPTIRSRCRRLALAPLDDEAMAGALAAYLPNVDADERTRLADLADGAPGRALLLADAEGISVARLVDDVLADLPAIGAGRGYAVADALGRSDTGFSTFMDLLRAAITAAVRAAARGRADPDQQRLAALLPLAGWAELWHTLTRLQDETERFALDKRQALVQALGLLPHR
ncbi:MAG: DNA polymerase III subunit delta' [Acetobacteraceae bacterium]|nr:DNA polymerase III subunit delta' [Acetobacteraceae bacterium]